MIKTIAAKSIGLYFNTTRYVAKDYTTERLFKLFCTPFSGRYSKEDLQFIHTADQHTLSTDEDDIVYHHWKGTSRRVLFIHGWESNTIRWQPYIELLQQQNLDIYSIDGPGLGMSSGKSITVLRYAAAIAALVDKHQPEIIVGHSLGGMAAGYYLRHYDSSVKELVLMSTPSGLADMMHRYFDILSLSKKVMPALDELFYDRYDIKTDEFSTARHLANCDLHGIIVHDQTDEVTPYPESLEINESWKNGIHIPTRNLGHSLKDDRIISAICNYISRGILPESIGI